MSQAIYPVERGDENHFAAAQHTPGPWEADTAGWPFVINAGESGESPNIVATIYCSDFTQAVAREHQFPEAVAEANARLIAAAPELLGALRAAVFCLRTFRNVPPEDQQWTSIDEDALTAGYSAIAFATGASECQTGDSE